ncbi:MAG: pyrroline-5-carboxylate reductase [Cyanobacteria bacterium J083]|nr:MAG: pyrroline-5-carboxylate reductase [Cyanobacteria bacterium J083]
MSIELSLIGGGVMGEAILSRLLAQKIYQPDAVIVAEISQQRRKYLHEKYKVLVTADNQQALKASQVILLAIKPQIFQQVVKELNISPQTSDLPLIISILAGITLTQLESAWQNYPVIRAMPNTPATVGAGMTAIASGQRVKSEQVKLAKSIFAAVGEVVEVPEYLMDAVTGLSGSGPAYVAIAIEALADGGVAAGLPRRLAQQLALQTVFGTAVLIKQANLHPAELKDRVTSPGGTTITGITALEKARFRSALIEAVLRAAERSQELSK